MSQGVITKKYLDDLTYAVIGCVIEVHKQLGPGLLESVYEKCFLKEMSIKAIPFKNQVWVPIEYKGLSFEAELRLDVLVDNILCVELKAQEQLLQKPKGILINFHCLNIFKEGQRTLVNEFFKALPEK